MKSYHRPPGAWVRRFMKLAPIQFGTKDGKDLPIRPSRAITVMSVVVATTHQPPRTGNHCPPHAPPVAVWARVHWVAAQKNMALERHVSTLAWSKLVWPQSVHRM